MSEATARAADGLGGLGVGRLADQIAGRHPTVGLAAGVVRGEHLEFFRGYGLADIASDTPITGETVFRIASITKTFTAIAVMQLWEKGLVDLDAPANEYLRAYQLIPAEAGWRPATLRHLLTHSAGLGELAHPSGLFQPDFGESVLAGEPMPSLAELYRGRLRLHAEPGTRFVYNNHGPATLGQIVEDVSGQTLDRYFEEHIFAPLGMNDSSLLRTEGVKSRLATGYEIGSGGPRQGPERDMATAGAASIYSSPRDMARYLSALVGGGSNEHGSVLEPASLAAMFAPQYQPDPRVPGVGLGFFRYDVGGRLAVGHQGTHPGFHSQILAVPGEAIGIMLFTNGARQADFWLPSEASRLMAAVIGVPLDRPVGRRPDHTDVWGDICGWYRLPARLTDIRLRGMMGFGVEVFRRAGRPMLRFLTPVPMLAKGFPLIHDDETDPWVFRIEPLGPEFEPMHVIFSRDADGLVTRVVFDVMPLALAKQPVWSNPRWWALGTAGALGMAVASRKRLGA